MSAGRMQKKNGSRSKSLEDTCWQCPQDERKWRMACAAKAPKALGALRAGAPTGVRRKSATRNMNFRMPSLLAITAESEMAIVRPRYLHAQDRNISRAFISMT